MGYQSIFQRHEIKYLITREQMGLILQELDLHLRPDAYGPSTVRNLYFDTDSYRLIRRSLEKPVYKEKLRLRCYCQAREDTPVFVELKKKYKGVVYKRRLSLPEGEAMAWLCGRGPGPDRQIGREIDCFLAFYGSLQPKAVLFYDRQAWYDREDPELRITFDDNIRFRQTELSLQAQVGGIPLLPPDQILMEIKCTGAMPLWLTQVLTRHRLYKTSFSKYGTAYRNYIFQGENTHA